MTAQLQAATGWGLEIVPGLIPVDDFFALLAQQRFCTSTWVRRPDQLDYLEEPDMFHDTFGHVPPLMNPEFAAFMKRFGEIGVALRGREEHVLALQRLYWFFVEFGFVEEQGRPMAFGAGIELVWRDATRVEPAHRPAEIHHGGRHDHAVYHHGNPDDLLPHCGHLRGHPRPQAGTLPLIRPGDL